MKEHEKPLFMKELFLKLQDNQFINFYPFVHFLAGASLTATAPSTQDLASTVTPSRTIGDNLTSSHAGTPLHTSVGHVLTCSLVFSTSGCLLCGILVMEQNLDTGAVHS